MLFAVLAYNNSIHSATDKKPIEIINGHLDSRDPLDILLEKQYLQNYINKHKEITTTATKQRTFQIRDSYRINKCR